jgi:hypothetical protein
MTTPASPHPTPKPDADAVTARIERKRCNRVPESVPSVTETTPVVARSRSQ